MTAAKAPAELPLWDADGLTLTGLNALREPTPAAEIKQRAAPGGSGKMLDYVDARFVMDRLDVMAGPQNWQDRYEDVPNVSPPAMRCYLRIKVMGEWIEKADVGDASTIEPTKGASSDAFKRAGVKWGIARDLYDAREDSAAPVQRATFQPQAAPAYQPQPAQGRQPQPAPQAGVPPMAALNPTGWLCPIHGTAIVRPGGTSARTGKPYGPFVSCGAGSQAAGWCNEKPPRTTVGAVVATAEPSPIWEGAGYEEEPPF